MSQLYTVLDHVCPSGSGVAVKLNEPSCSLLGQLKGQSAHDGTKAPTQTLGPESNQTYLSSKSPVRKKLRSSFNISTLG